jgi:hypothetical protein
LSKINKADILSQGVFFRFMHLIAVCNQLEIYAKELTFYEFNNIKLNHQCICQTWE